MGQKEPIRAFCLQGFRTTIASVTVSATYLQNVDLQSQPGHALTRE